jgi:hypothetical protein
VVYFRENAPFLAPEGELGQLLDFAIDANLEVLPVERH